MDGLELCNGRDLSLVGAGRALEGVGDRNGAWREDGVEGLAVDGERVMGEDGLV